MPFRILSFDGGGYLGLATASFVLELERHFQKTVHEQFDLFCGTSTGAILALAFASGLTGEKVAKLYLDFGPAVFRNPVWGFRQGRNLLAIGRSMYSNKVLKEKLDEVFKDITLGDIQNIGKLVLIPAFNVTAGRPRIFKTDHSKDLTTDSAYRAVDVALASSAAPIYLPVWKVKSPSTGVAERFCDGGIFANHPALLGYGEAIYHLHKNPAEIQLLSISTPRTDYAEDKPSFRTRIEQRGVVTWPGGAARLPALFIEASSDISNETLKRVSSPSSLIERVKLENRGNLALDDASVRASESLQQIGKETAVQGATRDKVKKFFE